MSFKVCEHCKESDEDVLEFDDNMVIIGCTSYNYLHQECLDELEDALGENQDFSIMHPDETEEEFLEHEDGEDYIITVMKKSYEIALFIFQIIKKYKILL